jgi:hypothetical protein
MNPPYAGQCKWGLRFAPDRGGLEVDEREANIQAVVRHMRASGHTIREIVDLLAAMGVLGRRGTPIGATRVFEMIHGGRAKKRA